MAQRVGADVVLLEADEKVAVGPELIEKYIKKYQPKLLTIVQDETSKTAGNKRLKTITLNAKEHGCLVIVDAICRLSSMQIEMEL